MRRKNREKVFLLGLAILMCIGLIAMNTSAYAKEVKVPIGINMSLTGGLAATTIPISFGMLDYVTYINDQGGFEYKSSVDGKVYRAKYDIMWADNAFTVARSMTNVRRFAAAGAKAVLVA